VPELPEVESYRRLLADSGLDRPISAVVAADAWYLKRGLDAPTVTDALVGRCLVAARRRGKLLLADTSDTSDTSDGPVLGLRFGMSGRLLIDGAGPIDRLQYAPTATEARWDRFVITFVGGGDVRLQDPRRLGGVELDPDESALGPDALGITLVQLGVALRGGSVALKARLLDQSKVAGVGNLVADELLWRTGLAPTRPAGDLDDGELRRLQRGLGTTLRMLVRRGGSHTGDLGPERRRGGHCPRDGQALRRGTVGGRTTWWCPTHQV